MYIMMVSVKGDRGFHRIREYNDGLDDTDLTSYQKARKRYFDTENGRREVYEQIKKYQRTENGRKKQYEAILRYMNKPYYCSSCDKHILMKSKYLHLKSQNHIEKSI